MVHKAAIIRYLRLIAALQGMIKRTTGPIRNIIHRHLDCLHIDFYSTV